MSFEFALLWVMALVAVVSVIGTALFLFVIMMKLREVSREVSDIKIGIADSFRHLEKPLGDIISEERRSNRLVSELLALKQAEMTGDFEIVEEPVAQNVPPVSEEQKIKATVMQKAAAVNLAPPPQGFPKI